MVLFNILKKQEGLYSLVQIEKDCRTVLLLLMAPPKVVQGQARKEMRLKLENRRASLPLILGLLSHTEQIFTVIMPTIRTEQHIVTLQQVLVQLAYL